MTPQCHCEEFSDAAIYTAMLVLSKVERIILSPGTIGTNV